MLALEGSSCAHMLPLLTILSSLFFLFFPLAAGAAGGVVINEIKVGGAEKATDEFVELYNAGSEDVNLAGWRLSKKTASGSLANLLTEFPSVTIPAHGFLLIAHNDYIGAAPKDFSYSTQSSITADNTVILYSDNGKTVVDLVGMGSAGEGSNAVTPEPGQSIERKQVGSDSDNNANDFILRTVPTPKQTTNDQQGIGSGGQGTENSDQGATSPPSTGERPFAPTNIIISELLPNPAGSDEEGEWIELVNLGSTEVDLSDWSVEDASGKHFTIKQGGAIASTTIAPNGYFLLPRSATGISLNNTDSETVKLLNPQESVAHTVTYSGTAKDNYSWARDAQGNYAWTTTPTAGASNVITQPEIVIKTEPNRPTSTGAINRAPTPPPSAPSSPPLLVINELLPNPAGDDVENEWIEFYNNSEDEASTVDVTLEDAGGQKYQLADDFLRVAAKSYVLITRPTSGIALNNGGDTLTLRFRGMEIDRISYGPSKEGIAFAREGDTFSWTDTPTPGKENIVRLAVNEEEEEDEGSEQETAISNQEATNSGLVASAQIPHNSAGNSSGKDNKKTSTKTSRTTSAPQNSGIDSLRSLPKGKKVSVTGTVIVPPNVFGTTQFYLNGIQIYSVSYPYPELAVGDRVSVSGTLSASGGESRITVPKTGSVKLIEHGEAPAPQIVSAESLGDEYEGMLVKVEGEIMEKKGTTLWLDDGTGEARIVLKEGIGVSEEEFVVGNRLAVTGVLSETASGYRLLPRGAEDLETRGEVRGAQATMAGRTSNDRPLYYVITALAAIVIAAGVGIQKWKMHRLMNIPLHENMKK